MGGAREERAAGLGLNEPLVRAAGGVVARRRRDGTAEVLLVHRPRYDDWTLPKGKALPGESDEDCALREVEEETGLRCALEYELPSTAYRDQKGRRKVVRYWAMRAPDDEVQPRDEVDEARWLTLEQADALLSYDRDRAVLAALAQETRAQ
jgi:8-oxo-dGTP diphosphatase